MSDKSGVKIKVKVRARPRPRDDIGVNIDHVHGRSVSGVTVYPTEVITNDPVKGAAFLHKYGVVVVPCIATEELKQIQTDLLGEISVFPEYIHSTPKYEVTDTGLTVHTVDGTYNIKCPQKKALEVAKGLDRFTDPPQVLGSFQALGSASSFHCPTVRTIRRMSYASCAPILRKAYPGHYLEMNFDRLGHRRRGTEIKEDKDKWHRDQAPAALVKEGDEILGGWVNLDITDQYFICAMGTQGRVASHGFLKEHLQPGETGNKVRIPGGHAIIFYQHLLHAIAPVGFQKDSYRLFLSWRIVPDRGHPPQPFLDKMKVIQSQAVSKLPSGQTTDVTSAHHRSALLWKYTMPWTLCTLRKECIWERNTVSGNNTYYVPHLPLPSLESLGAMYPPYEQEDIDILMPKIE